MLMPTASMEASADNRVLSALATTATSDEPDPRGVRPRLFICSSQSKEGPPVSGTVHDLAARRESVTIERAIEEFLHELAHTRQASGALTSPRTVLAYRRALQAVLAPQEPIGLLDEPAAATRLRTAIDDRWGQAATGTWNARLSALSAAMRCWQDRSWLATDPLRGLTLRSRAEPEPRARPRRDIETLLRSQRHPVRERCLWAMLYATAARAEEILALDVADLDRANRMATVTRKGGRREPVTWSVRTARLLSAMLRDRTHGPLFLTDRAGKGARTGEIRPADLADDGRKRLGYRQALQRFSTATGGWSLHDLRHSALTHLAEDGMDTTMLMVKSGHRDIRSLARYARPSIEAVRRFEDDQQQRRR